MSLTRLQAELATATGTGILGIAGLIGALDLGTSWTPSGPESGYFPFWISIVLIAASLWNFIAALRHMRAGDELALALAERFIDPEGLKRVAIFFAELFAFVMLTITLGIYVATVVYLSYSAYRHGGYRAHVALFIGLSFALSQYVVFELAFKVPLLKGPLEAALGIY